MNNPRRKRIQKLIDLLDELIYEEQEAYDNLPESIQESERGDRLDECIQQMDAAKSELEYAIEP